MGYRRATPTRKFGYYATSMVFCQSLSERCVLGWRFAVLTACFIATLTSLSPAWGDAKAPPTVVSICGSTINVQIEGDSSAANHADILRWVRRAGEAVCAYYGKFPVPQVALDVQVRGGDGVDGGVTYPDNGGYIRISLGKDTPTTELDNDWMLTHEMIHLAFPSMSRKHHWI